MPPKLIKFVNATYPPAAQQAGLQAAVKLSLAVDATGQVIEARVLEPAGHGFDEAAAEAARDFGFEPATVDGQPVGVEIRFTYRFTLEQQPVRPAPPPPTAEQQPLPPPLPAVPTLRGQVLRRGNREVLAGIGVRVTPDPPPAPSAPPPPELVAETDATGRFGLPVPPGNWIVEALHPDFLPFRTTEALQPGEALDVVFYLEARSTTRYRSVVTASRPKKTVTRTTLEDVELVQVPGTFGEPFRVIQTLPGVARAPYSLGLLLIRGAAPTDTGIFIDGHEVPLLYHFLFGPAIFQAELIKSIDFYPGNFPVEFGRKQAGIVTVRTKDEPAGDRLHGLASVDVLDLELLLRLPLGEDAQLAGAFRHSHVGLFVPLFTDTNVLPSYWDYQLIGDTKLGRRWSGKLSVFGSNDTLDFSDDPESEDDPGTSMQANLGIQFHRLHLTAVRAFVDGGQLELTTKLGFNRVLSTQNENLVHVDGLEGTARAQISWPLLGDRLTLSGGAEFNALQFLVDLDVPGLRHWTDFPAPSERGKDTELPRTTFEFDYWGFGPALFAQLEWKLGPLLLIPGIRGDWVKFDAFQDLTFDPRLMARYQLLEQLTFKGGIGIFHQLPINPAIEETFGNPQAIDTPYALQYAVGAEARPWEFVDIDATLFFNHYRDQIVASRVKEVGGQIETGNLWTNDGEGRAYGLELLLRHRPRGPFFGWIAYTLARTERRRLGEPWALSQLDQSHNLTLVGSLALGSRWNVGLKFQLVTGYPRTPVLGGAFDSDTGRYVPILGEPFSDRNPTFHQLDLRVDRTFLFDSWKLLVYLDILNVYNASNTEFIRYNYNYTQSEVVQGIPILPSLGVRGEF